MADVVPLGGKPVDEEERVRREETALLVTVRDTGDRAAYEQLFARFAPKLKRYLASLNCDHATAEGIVQDVMIAVWTKARLFHPEKASARTWIYTLVRNRMIDLKRAGARRAKAYEGYGTTLDGEQDGGLDPHTHAEFGETTRFMQDLPPEQAEVLLMAYVEGKSHREIAEQLAIPIGTVKSRARLAFQRLRKNMEVDA